MKMNTMIANHLTKRTGTVQTSWRDKLVDGFRESCAGAMVRRRFRLWMRCEVQKAADRSDAILAYSLQRGSN